MERSSYTFREQGSVPSPALVYYPDIIRENIRQMVDTAGANRLWPHIKTHKCPQVTRMLLDSGITRIKCATIAEAEMAASCGAAHVLLAYPLVGPGILRFLRLREAYPGVHFWTIGDDRGQLELLGRGALESGGPVDVLLDLNTGMDRTGVPLRHAAARYRECAALEGIRMQGFHCYDGHLGHTDLTQRAQAVEKEQQEVRGLCEQLAAQGCQCPVLVMGGSPTFPCHAKYPGCYLSPGTLPIHDEGYAEKYPDMEYRPGAALLTRVISHPEEGIFTLDLGYKGIAADPEGSRGRIEGLPEAEELFQSEEHWTFRMKTGAPPPIGTVLFVVPTHICPTSALYPSALAVSGEELTGEWEITARNRKITL